MRKYHETKSDRVRTRIINDVLSIPETDIKRRYLTQNIPYGYPIHTSQQLKEEEEEEEEEKEQESDPVGVVFAHYQNNINASMGSREFEIIDEWIKAYPPDWITSAIDVAVDNNKRKLSYVRGVLRNYQSAGHITEKPKQYQDNPLEGYTSA